MKYRFDCLYFKGEKPCLYKRLCRGCPYYHPFKKRILIIKLAATGDVLRTTPLLYGLKRKYPISHITWLTEPDAAELLKFNSLIDSLLVYNVESIIRLNIEHFDILICLDKEPKATSLAMMIKARKKFGFGMSKFGTTVPLNKESRYMFNLGISDELKFKINRKTYQELIFEATKLEYQNDEYILNLSDEVLQRGKDKIKSLGVNRERPIIGLNTGSGRSFANKALTVVGFVDLIQKLKASLDIDILLLGGPQEKDTNKIIKNKAGEIIFDTGCDNTVTEFVAIINVCDIVVSADTLAMHIAIGLKKKVVTIFGPTCSQEIELYGRGKKIVSTIECAPCYKNECNKEPNCMSLISTDEVLAAIKGLL